MWPIYDTLQKSVKECLVPQELVASYTWQLLEYVTQKTKAKLIAEQPCFSQDEEYLLRAALKRLKNNEPLQYIIGKTQFLNCFVAVRSPILIPRHETEEWVVQLITYIRKHAINPQSILDVGTGTGCIALSLAKEFSNAVVTAVDVNQDALDLAAKNAYDNALPNVHFMRSDVYNGIPQEATFDVIVSNPPYVRESDWNTLDNSVTQWEDKNAIIAQDDGFAIIKRIIKGAYERLRCLSEHSGILCIEIDIHQGICVQKLFYAAGFKNVIIIQDLHKRDWAVLGIMR